MAREATLDLSTPLSDETEQVVMKFAADAVLAAFVVLPVYGLALWFVVSLWPAGRRHTKSEADGMTFVAHLPRAATTSQPLSESS